MIATIRELPAPFKYDSKCLTSIYDIGVNCEYYICVKKSKYVGGLIFRESLDEPLCINKLSLETAQCGSGREACNNQSEW